MRTLWCREAEMQSPRMRTQGLRRLKDTDHIPPVWKRYSLEFFKMDPQEFGPAISAIRDFWATCSTVPPTVDDQKALETYWCLCCTYTCTSLTPPLQNEEAGSDPCAVCSWLTFTAVKRLTKNKQTLYCVSALLSPLFTISVNSKPQICAEITDSVVS